MRVAPLLGVLVLCAVGCAGKKEIHHLRVENELLREEVRIIRKNCSYYRDIEIAPETDEAPQGPR